MPSTSTSWSAWAPPGQYDADVLVLYDDTTDLQALTRRLAALAGQGKRALARRQAEGLQGKEILDLRGGKQA